MSRYYPSKDKENIIGRRSQVRDLDSGEKFKTSTLGEIVSLEKSNKNVIDNIMDWININDLTIEQYLRLTQGNQKPSMVKKVDDMTIAEYIEYKERSIYEYLKPTNLKGTAMSVKMDDMTQQEIFGTVKNFLVKINKSEFPWKKDGRMMLDSIDNGPLVYLTVEENGQTRLMKYFKLPEAQQLQDDYDV
nr:hypothetical protein [Tanacetum cinerariifolium]